MAIDGDLVLAAVAAAGAVFFWFIYNAITAGKRKRKKRSDDFTNKMQIGKFVTLEKKLK